MAIKEAIISAPGLSLTLGDRTGQLAGLILGCEAALTDQKVGDAVLVCGTFSRCYNDINLQRVTKVYAPQVGEEL